MAPRKTRAPRRRRAPRRKAVKKVTYPDRHNWKLEAGAQVIYNSSGSTVSAAGTSLQISNVVNQRTNFKQFGGAFYFSLDKCLGTAGFLKANFDRYKINAIKIRVIPENNFSNTSGGGTLGTMKVCYDYDDENIPTVGDVEVRRGRTYRLDKPFTVSLKPRVNNVVAGGAGNTAFAPMPAPWCNMAQSGTPHYGIKFMIRDWYCTTSNPPNDLQLRFQITYMVSVKEQIAINRGPSLVEDVDPQEQELFNINEDPSLYNVTRDSSGNIITTTTTEPRS